MRIRIKKRGTFGVKKIKLDGKIGKVERKEGMGVFVKGLEGVALISFSPQEVNMMKEKLLPGEVGQISQLKSQEIKAGWTANKEEEKPVEIKEEPKVEVSNPEEKVEENSSEKKVEKKKKVKKKMKKVKVKKRKK